MVNSEITIQASMTCNTNVTVRSPFEQVRSVAQASGKKLNDSI